jgi:hypothetical protein
MPTTKVSAALLESGTKGVDIASASTIVIGTDGSYFDITGTTGIGTMTVDAGRIFTLQFDGAVILTHSSTLYLAGAANFTTEANDHLTFVAVAANDVRQIGFGLTDGGSPVASGGGLVASNTVSGSAVTSFSFTGLDLDTHISYIIEMEILADAGNNLFSIYANNLQTATDYRSQLIQATSTTVNSEQANNARIGYLSDGYRTRSIIHVGYSTGRYFYASAQFVRQHSSTTGFITINGVWKPTELVANLTRLDIVHSTASGFGVGTKVRIYKR